MQIQEPSHFGCTRNNMKVPMVRIEITKQGFMEWGKEVMPMVFIGCGVCVVYGILQITEEFFRNIGDGIHRYIFPRGLRINGCTLLINTQGLM